MAGRMKWLKSPSKEVLGINERNLNWVYTRNPRKHFDLANNKVLTKQILIAAGIPVTDQMGTISRIGEIEEKWGQIPKRDCAIKPAHGSGGGGILVVQCGFDGWTKGGKPITEAEIRKHIANIVFGVFSFGSDDVALIEEKIIPHSAITAIYSEGVADLRVIVCDGVAVMAMLRIPTARSQGKANLHQGAIGIGIDMATGRTTTAFTGSDYLHIHPDSKHPLIGIEVPFWTQCIDIALATAAAFPLNYLGIDITFDEYKGPLVLEINVRPGLEIQNVNRKGLKSVLPRS